MFETIIFDDSEEKGQYPWLQFSLNKAEANVETHEFEGKKEQRVDAIIESLYIELAKKLKNPAFAHYIRETEKFKDPTVFPYTPLL